jgi:hypothetical protein
MHLLAFLLNEIFERWDIRMNLDLIFRSLRTEQKHAQVSKHFPFKYLEHAGATL